MSEQIPIKEGIFKAGLDGYRLIAGKCESCGQVFFPNIPTCLDCGHETVVETELDKVGKLYSYSVVQMPSSKFKPPYAVGYVDLAGGVRIFTQLDIKEDKPFKVGMEMALNVNTLWQEEGHDVIGYRFAPV
jgi:uncharacterized OB-fold protein